MGWLRPGAPSRKGKRLLYVLPQGEGTAEKHAKGSSVSVLHEVGNVLTRREGLVPQRRQR